MGDSTWPFRATWAVLFASLLVWIAMPYVVPPRAQTWYDAQTAVAGFVFAIFALVASVASFALRESLLRDAEPARGGGLWVRTRLVSLWLLCALVGVLGGIMIHYSGRPAVGWPYLALAAGLFVVHAPRPALLRRVQAPAESAQPRG
ncbi:MAG: hypothetical protein MUF70_15295 [Myxococcota bacterium]|jgi:hypothetical protein|nr:hypothetical protein [Myxococcota bacterium]